MSTKKQDPMEYKICPLAYTARKRPPGCLRGMCAWWDDDWGCCSMAAKSRHEHGRIAASDAMVDVVTHYELAKGDDGK